MLCEPYGFRAHVQEVIYIRAARWTQILQYVSSAVSVREIQ